MTEEDEQAKGRRRGRPPTGKALTPAQKQKAYRERKMKRLADLQDVTKQVTSSIIDLSELPLPRKLRS